MLTNIETAIRNRDEKIKKLQDAVRVLTEKNDELRQKALLTDSEIGPHTDPIDCPTFYDGCHCTVGTLEHSIDSTGRYRNAHEVAMELLEILKKGSLKQGTESSDSIANIAQNIMNAAKACLKENG